MSGFENYEHLPGHIAEFKDNNIEIPKDPMPTNTDSVLFLGTATDGPLMQPVPVTPETIKLFGKSINQQGVANGATLVRKFEEAWNEGIRDIRLMRVTGKKAKLNLMSGSYVENKVSIQDDNLGLADGNAEQLFELSHGGVDPLSVQVFSNNVLIPSTAYTLDAGTASDSTLVDTDGTTPLPDPEVKAVLTLHANVTNQESKITISYKYKFIDAANPSPTGKTADVIAASTDADGAPMIAKGEVAGVNYDLTHEPKPGLKLYADGALIPNDGFYEVLPPLDLASPDPEKHLYRLNIKSNRYIAAGAELEVSYEYSIEEIITPTIELESVFAGETYNGVLAEVVKDDLGNVAEITIKKPEEKKKQITERPMVFSSEDYSNFDLMVRAINAHPDNNVVTAKTNYPERKTQLLEKKDETPFTGGSSELNLTKSELYERLGGTVDSEGYISEQGAYQLLENYTVDFVVPIGVYADDKLVGKYDNFTYQLALACAVMSHYNNVTIGLISTTTPVSSDLKSIEDHVRKLEAIDNTYYMKDRLGNRIKDADGKPIDLGQFVSIIAGPDVIVGNREIGAVATNDPAAFVGLVGQLPVRSAPTNKAYKSALDLRFEYSKAQMNRLAANRLVVMKKKTTGEVAVVDAITTAHKGSDYANLSTVRIVKQAVGAIRRVTEPYLGEPNDTANRNAMTAAINKELDTMKNDEKSLRGYDFMVIATPQMEVMGEARIELTLMTPFELKKITTVVSLSN